MFRFANINYLYLLFILPALIVIYLIVRYFYRKRIVKYTDSEFVDTLMPLRSESRRSLKFIIFLFAIACFIIAIARPQFGSKLEEVKKKGIELIIALDVSRSMLAQDIKPNRLIRAKEAIITLVNRLKNDKIGMIVFAGDAYTQLPITTDYISAKLFLSNINTDIVSKQGTDIASAIKLGEKSFTQDADASKVIIIISDGEDHEGHAAEAAKEATEKGIKVFTIGMGSPNGTPIPNGQGGFLKDRQGNVVISKMDPTTLSNIASAGDGEFYPATTGMTS